MVVKLGLDCTPLSIWFSPFRVFKQALVVCGVKTPAASGHWSLWHFAPTKHPKPA